MNPFAIPCLIIDSPPVGARLNAKIVSIHVDCDADTILLKVKQHGAACHEGYASCFFRELRGDEVVVDADRLLDPKDIYRS